MARVTFTTTPPVAEVDPMWRDVAQGTGPADWPDQVPETVRNETSGEAAHPGP